MAYIAVHPKSSVAQQRLGADRDVTMNILARAIKEVLGVPDHDIIVELNQCTVVAFNALAEKANSAPDVVIKISTSDHQFQPRFQALCDRIVTEWDKTFTGDLKLEIWVSLIDTWATNMEFA